MLSTSCGNAGLSDVLVQHGAARHVVLDQLGHLQTAKGECTGRTSCAVQDRLLAWSAKCKKNPAMLSTSGGNAGLMCDVLVQHGAASHVVLDQLRHLQALRHMKCKHVHTRDLQHLRNGCGGVAR
jgi:hypothetical protein